MRSSIVWASSTIVSSVCRGPRPDDVLVDQVDGLGAERVPHKPAGYVGGPDRLVDVGQPPVVVAIRREHRVGADRLPQLGDDAVRQAEGVLRCVVGDRCLGLHEALVAADGSVDTGEERQCRVDRRARAGSSVPRCW